MSSSAAEVPRAQDSGRAGLGTATSFVSRRWLAFVPGLVVLAAFFLVPTFLILARSLEVGSGIWADVILARTSEGRSIRRTILIAAEVTVLTAALGYAYAMTMVRVRRHWRGLLTVALILPFLTSILIRSYGWIQILNPNGPIGAVWADFFDSPPPQVLYNRTGVLIGMTSILLPLFVLPLYAVLAQVPPTLVKAARTLGSTRTSAFLRITLPLSVPGMTAGGLLVFIQSLGFFVTPALLGGRADSMVAQVIDRRLANLADVEGASVLAVLLICSVLVPVGVFRVFYPIENLLVEAADGKSQRRRQRRRQTRRRGSFAKFRRRLIAPLDFLPWEAIGVLLTGLSIALLISPMLAIFPVAFTDEPFLRWLPEDYGTTWLRTVIADPGWRSAAVNSLFVGVGASAIAVLVGVPVAVGLARSRVSNLAKGLILGLFALPALIPIVVLAIGSFVWFLDLQLLSNRLALATVHATLGLPFVVFLVTAALRDQDEHLEMAARSLGATKLTAFRRITLRLIMPAVLSSAFFAFLVSFDELLIARAVLRLAGVETLPMKMWTGANEEISPALAAVSVIQVTVILVGAGIVWAWLARRRRIGAANA